jgi:Bacterial archaeo-eukaryotic release factor family 3
MNRALLADLQHRRIYPSVTVLANTSVGAELSELDEARLAKLIADADRRLRGDVADTVREEVIGALVELVAERRLAPTARAVALCASPEHAVAVVLGSVVDERVVVDDTFATRDLVADLNRTAVFRVVTISDRTVRLLVGDRQRLVEERDESWPLIREPDTSATNWNRQVGQRLRESLAGDGLPTVVAGVDRRLRDTVALDLVPRIGVVPGNHDRTGWVELHRAAWPIVSEWLGHDRRRAMTQLDRARSERRFAGGIEEVWSLAAAGRVDVVVVEEHFAYSARTDGFDRLEPADDPESPDVVDDVVDDTIEAVLRFGGSAVIVPDGDLEAHDRIAAVLRY